MTSGHAAVDENDGGDISLDYIGQDKDIRWDGCYQIEWKGRYYMVDLPVYRLWERNEVAESVGFLEDIPWEEMEVVLLSSARRFALLPWLILRTGFRGQVIATRAATTAARAWLVYLHGGDGSNALGNLFPRASSVDIERALSRVVQVSYDESIPIPGAAACASSSGGSLGGAFWRMRLGTKLISYTGDDAVLPSDILLTSPADINSLRGSDVLLYSLPARAQLPQTRTQMLTSVVREVRAWINESVEPSVCIFELPPYDPRLATLLDEWTRGSGAAGILVLGVGSHMALSVALPSASPEWLAPEPLAAAMAGVPPLRLEDAMRSGRLQIVNSLYEPAAALALRAKHLVLIASAGLLHSETYKIWISARSARTRVLNLDSWVEPDMGAVALAINSASVNATVAIPVSKLPPIRSGIILWNANTSKPKIVGFRPELEDKLILNSDGRSKWSDMVVMADVSSGISLTAAGLWRVAPVLVGADPNSHHSIRVDPLPGWTEAPLVAQFSPRDIADRLIAAGAVAVCVDRLSSSTAIIHFRAADEHVRLHLHETHSTLETSSPTALDVTRSILRGFGWMLMN